jgi:hypothetical protein
VRLRRRGGIARVAMRSRLQRRKPCVTHRKAGSRWLRRQHSQINIHVQETSTSPAAALNRSMASTSRLADWRLPLRNQDFANGQKRPPARRELRAHPASCRSGSLSVLDSQARTAEVRDCVPTSLLQFPPPLRSCKAGAVAARATGRAKSPLALFCFPVLGQDSVRPAGGGAYI